MASVPEYSEVARARLAAVVARLMATGTPAPLANAKALAIVDGQVTRQALMLSFEQLFLLFGACFVLSHRYSCSCTRARGCRAGRGRARRTELTVPRRYDAT